ncbi:MAG: hypothetical protein OEY20_02205 [Gemmatimonadota bacterium]|nr:hypothetical protein [Gemmatimonadota bacterium]
MVERDGVAFTGQAIPDPVLDRLAANRVVLLGETHHLREHYEFVAALLRALHARGFRQLLVEWPHMADWLLEDYVSRGQIAPNWEPPLSLGQPMFAAIREFNDTLSAADRVHVRAIDVNLDEYGGAPSFRDLMGVVGRFLPTAGPITAFLAADYGSSAAQTQAIESLQASLAADQTTLTAAWGAAWYDTVVEMAEIERVSIGIRAIRDTDYDRSVRMREDVIKQLADTRIGAPPGRTVINIGSTHAQKKRFRGTELEWLGDYLVHRSAVVDGSIIVVAVGAAKVELEPGAGGTPYDILDTSPANELFRVMIETWPGQTVFLPFGDPVFADVGVPMNFEETIYVVAPRTHYDGVLQFALAHRVPDE